MPHWDCPGNPTKRVTYEQDDHGDLTFAIRVGGLIAKPHSPAREAERICQVLTEALRADGEISAKAVVDEPDQV